MRLDNFQKEGNKVNVYWNQEALPYGRSSNPSRSAPQAFLTNSFLSSYAPSLNEAETQSFTSAFLAHARLYVLPAKYLIHPLKGLAIYKIHKTLAWFSLYSSRIDDFLTLILFVFSDDHPPGISKDGKMDELRRVVTEYVVCKVDTIGKKQAFFDLLEEGGDFVRAFWAIMQVYK